MTAVLMPDVGYATQSGIVLKWLAGVGQQVEQGAPLLEIGMEKTVFELAAPRAGTLLATYVLPGAIVPVGEVIGWIGVEGQQAPTMRCRILGWAPEVGIPPADWPEAPPEDDAEELEAALTAPDQGQAALNKPYKEFLRQQIRPVTAERMTNSWRRAPKVDLFAEVDFSGVTTHRAQVREAGQNPAPVNVYIAFAAVRAFEEFPELNCHWLHERREPVDGIHVGLAVALGDNLLTVSLRDLQGADLPTIGSQYRAMIRKALGLSLSHDDLFGSSITLTSLGEFDVTAFTAVINPPELFILAIGKLEDKPVVRGGAVVAAPMCTLCLSFDHRGVDGAPASRLLQRIKHHIETFA